MFKKEEIKNLLGTIVRNERLNNKLTQAQLAEYSELDDTYISQIERGLANPSIFTLHKIVRSLNMSEYELYLKMTHEYNLGRGTKKDSAQELIILFNSIGKLAASVVLTNTEDDDFRILYCNDAFIEMLGEEKGDIIGEKLFDKLSDGVNDDTLLKYLEGLKDIPNSTRSIELSDHNGVVNGYEVNSSSVKDNKNGGIEKHVFMIRDEVDTADAQEEIKKIIQKYTTLLDETNHRIKNNLAVIIGIIDLELVGSNSQKVRGFLEGVQMRLGLLAKQHELLLITDDHHAELSTPDYLEKLIDLIRVTAGKSPNVEVRHNFDHTNLSINNTFTLGLLSNELLTNSFKYAFPNNEKGSIKIELSQNESGVLFSYSDDGIGFDKEKIEDLETTGLHLIRNFMDQLEAENVKINTDAGFELSFHIGSNGKTVSGN